MTGRRYSPGVSSSGSASGGRALMGPLNCRRRQAHHPRPAQESGPSSSFAQAHQALFVQALYDDVHEIERIDESMRLLFPADYERLLEAEREVFDEA